MLDQRILISFLSVIVVSAKIPLWPDEKPTYRQPDAIVCIHGDIIDNKCQCDAEFVGEYCEKAMHCASFRRFQNGSCTSCLSGYSGNYCEIIDCVNGELSIRGTECVCDKPYIGTFCTNLTTSNVYSFYNNKMYTIGPLGAIFLIPMCLTYICCERMAKKREVKRLSNQLGEYNIVTTNGTLKYLLKNDV